VLDIGGDDRGALALGRYAPGILAERDYEMLLVVNRFRPLSHDAPDTLQILREIEKAGGVKFTAIVNNSNLGLETTAEDVLSSLAYAAELSRDTGLPVKMTSADERLCPALEGKIADLFPLRLQKRDFF